MNVRREFTIFQGCLWRRHVFFDVHAYRKFVANDVVLCGIALIDAVERDAHGDQLNFKFLKYGTGFFAGDFERIVNKHILSGVVDGLERLFNEHGDKVVAAMKHLEFPFYDDKDKDSIVRLQRLKKTFGVNYSFSQDDALEATKAGLITATTNCGDSMAVIGNSILRYNIEIACIQSNQFGTFRK